VSGEVAGKPMTTAVEKVAADGAALREKVLAVAGAAARVLVRKSNVPIAKFPLFSPCDILRAIW
jgi:hypothetical protein